MLTVDGRRWGTADEIAKALGRDITPTMVRNWARRNGLQTAAIPGAGRGTVRYPLDQAAAIEHTTRTTTRGRPRRVDQHATAAA